LGLLPISKGQNPAAVPLSGKILVLEPRRLAAQAAARYMAKLLGEEVGQQVGYRVRLESKVSKLTRVELLTEGMFTRRLLADPELSGVSCVIFDEFHERALQADFGLALCLESAGAFRSNLRLLVMSATLETGELSRFLGDCPIIEAKGRNWPVEVRHAGRELTIAPASSLEDVAEKTALAVLEALHSESGSILVFLPGQAEIRRTAELLEKRPSNTDMYPLYGDLPLREQGAAIAPSPSGRRKVVLATDLAQTSLTIEGVRLVIDAGLTRGPRFDSSTGLSRLVTTRLTQDAADQRAGRAGRIEPGLCLRLWPEKESLFPHVRPEIMDADLAPLCLDALTWGTEPAALPWLTPPPEAALQNASEMLLALDAVRFDPGHRLVITLQGQNLPACPYIRDWPTWYCKRRN
jgi:ATP-dependent helicase HrpB